MGNRLNTRVGVGNPASSIKGGYIYSQQSLQILISELAIVTMLPAIKNTD